MKTHVSSGQKGWHTLGVIGALLVLQAVLVAAFVLPQHKPEPHDVPVGVVAAAGVAEELEAAHPAELDVRPYSSESAARKAIEEREIYGALVGEGDGSRLLVASAASPFVAHMLTTGVGEPAGAEVVELAPLAEGDPRGATLNLLFLPLLIVCFPAVVLLSKVGLSTGRLLGAITGFAALGGLAVVGFVKGLDALPGSYLALSAVAALVILAVGLTTAGLVRLIGHGGIGLGVLLFVLIGNPASGNGTAPELLPGFWRWIGQYMPSGAGGTGLRNVAYFDGNAIAQPLLVLSAYAAAGALLLVAGAALRRRREEGDDEPVELRPAA